ncbi:class I SAM-dependent methyltransferase [Streptomyces sp. NPDC057428]|uniref:class I SAM-dependent methyltransferase n=1 Tax=Streptomyces sp. NPDC057428 TaxID=3346129 RepID=UPI0036A0E7E8
MSTGARDDVPDRSHYGESLFRPEQAGEGERIDFGALAYDDFTMTRLRALGAGSGWHCLDVGAGTGTISRRLLKDGGVASVLAVDRDVRFVSERPMPGLEVLEADVTTPDFVSGQFQLVHARFVLMHLPERRRLITALAELVAPGGVLVLSDAVDLAGDEEPGTPYATAMRAMWQGLRATIGTDVAWVPTYPRLLREGRHVGAEQSGNDRHGPCGRRGRRRGGPVSGERGVRRVVGRHAHGLGVEDRWRRRRTRPLPAVIP